MPLLRAAAVFAIAIATGCATSSEDVSATPCGADGGRACKDTGGSVEIDSELADSSTPADTDKAVDDSMVTTPTDGSEGDAPIFPTEDTAPEDMGPTCDGGGTYCAGDAGGCKLLATDESNCGACGKVCTAAAGATVLCTGGKCIYSCKVGFEDCDGTTGCEVNTNTDEMNCGGCGKKCLTGETCTLGVCKAVVTSIETYESGVWPWSPWVNGNGSSTGTVTTTTCTHDGTRGYTAPTSNPVHYYRTDVSVGASGTKMTAWFVPGSGRVYIGFGATASGAYSVVAAPNTSQLMIEKEIPYGTYTALITKSRTWTTSAWHKLEIDFGASGLVTARIYSADGTTLLDTISTTIAGFTPGGVAFRAFGTGTCVDTLAR